MDIQFSAAVDSVKVKVKSIDNMTIRSCEMRFRCPFDDVIAGALSPEAKVALRALREHGMEAVTLPLDAIDAIGTLSSKATGTVIDIPQMVGVKAVCKEGDEEEGGPPMIDLVFSCLWSREVWIFLGEYAGAYVEITARDRQLSMPLGKPSSMDDTTMEIIIPGGGSSGKFTGKQLREVAEKLTGKAKHKQ